MFNIGDRVVCVDDGIRTDSGMFQTYGSYDTKLKIGNLYTVRGVRQEPMGLCIYLVEIYSPINPQTGIEFAYFANRFRKVDFKDNKIQESINKKLEVIVWRNIIYHYLRAD